MIADRLRSLLSGLAYRIQALRPYSVEWEPYRDSEQRLDALRPDVTLILYDGRTTPSNRIGSALAAALEATDMDMACGPLVERGMPDRVAAAGYELGRQGSDPLPIPLLAGEALRRRWASAVTTAFRPSGHVFGVRAGVVASIVERVGTSESSVVAELRRLGPWAVAWGAAHEGPETLPVTSVTDAIDRRDHGNGELHTVESPGPESPGTPCPPPAAIWIGDDLANRFPGLDHHELAPLVSIRHAATDWGVAERWGDHHFSVAMAEAFADLSVGARVVPRHAWAHPFAARDLVITLRGLVPAPPVVDRLNVLWVISHPGDLQPDEFDGYDLVAVASETDRPRVQSMTDVPVVTLLQATEGSQRRQPGVGDGSVVFVGNSRGVRRRAVNWAMEQGLPLEVYGRDWDEMDGGAVDLFGPIDRQAAGDRFNTASVVLGDHWDDMRELGYVSNRVFDVAAAGGLLISDRVTGIDEILPGIVTYESPEDLGDRVREWMIADSEKRRNRVASLQDQVLQGHTFGHRVRELLDAIRDHMTDRTESVNRLLDA